MEKVYGEKGVSNAWNVLMGNLRKEPVNPTARVAAESGAGHVQDSSPGRHPAPPPAPTAARGNPAPGGPLRPEAPPLLLFAAALALVLGALFAVRTGFLAALLLAGGTALGLHRGEGRAEIHAPEGNRKQDGLAEERRFVVGD